MLVPDGEDYEGVTDRYHVFRGVDAPRAMGQLSWLLHADVEQLQESASALPGGPNPEMVVAKTFEEQGLKVVRTPRNMFTVATPDDDARWRHAQTEFPDHPGLLLKYPKEFDLAVTTCGTEVTAQFLSTNKHLFLHPDDLEASAERVRLRSRMLDRSMHQGGFSVVPGTVPRNVAFLKLHKTSGTTIAYNLFRGLQLRADSAVPSRQFVSLGKGEYSPDVGKAKGGPCSVHNASMLDGCSAHKCQSGAADCALLQHNSLPLFQSRGTEGIHACLGREAITTAMFREPSSRTVSAYYYYACGTARTAEQLAKELSRPEVLKCAHAHEYGDTFGSHGLDGMRVGLTEEEDSYLVLLAHELGISLVAFEDSLPLMVCRPPFDMDSADFSALEKELANSTQVRDQLLKSTSKEFVIYDKVRSMYEAWQTMFPGGKAGLALAAQDLTRSETAWRQARKLDAKVPFTCPLDEHTSALLPQLDWRRSGLGTTENGAGFGYCSAGPAWPTSDCMRAEDTCLPSSSDCMTPSTKHSALVF